MLGELPALAAEFDDRHLVLVAALGAILLLDLPFDRQAVAVPAGHVVRVETQHLLALGHRVLENFIEGGTDMNIAVGVRWAVVKDEARAALCRRAQAAVEVEA